MKQGGLSNNYAERIASFTGDLGYHHGVYAHREATFTADMRKIASRYLRSIVVSTRIGAREQDIELTRSDATRLRDALTKAIEATREDETR